MANGRSIGAWRGWVDRRDRVTGTEFGAAGRFGATSGAVRLTSQIAGTECLSAASAWGGVTVLGIETAIGSLAFKVKSASIKRLPAIPTTSAKSRESAREERLRSAETIYRAIRFQRDGSTERSKQRDCATYDRVTDHRQRRPMHLKANEIDPDAVIRPAALVGRFAIEKRRRNPHRLSRGFLYRSVRRGARTRYACLAGQVV